MINWTNKWTRLTRKSNKSTKDWTNTNSKKKLCWKEMDSRLSQLEKEMEKANLNKIHRDKLHRKEIEDLNSQRNDKVDNTNAKNENVSKTKDTEKPPIHKAREYIPRKQFARTQISQDDLTKESPDLNPNYKSTWALQMELELRQAAKQIEQVEETPNDAEHSKEPVDNWELLVPKKKIAVRKPIEIKNWFADESDSNLTSLSSSSSDEDSNTWNKIENKKKKQIKDKKKRDHIKERMAEVANKAKRMIGLGPIDNDTINKIEAEIGNRKTAELNAVTDLLKNSLDFNDEEIDTINILETKQAASLDVIYIAVENPDHIKEIHLRRAANGLDDLIARDYIPPQYYERYMTLNRRASDKRTEDRSLKTQIRWGTRDIEMFTKVRGSQEPYQKVDTKEFMGNTTLPKFDNNKKWTLVKPNGLRRRSFLRKDASDLPARRN